tara:strand:- start:11828 stop:12046 length:219 start_codon:yes stop_codon:yes gene_type:complete
MCVFRTPALPGPDPSVEAERQERMAREMADARQRKEEALEGEITRRKRGTGARSLLTGQSGGIGFYNPNRNE